MHDLVYEFNFTSVKALRSIEWPMKPSIESDLYKAYWPPHCNLSNVEYFFLVTVQTAGEKVV